LLRLSPPPSLPAVTASPVTTQALPRPEIVEVRPIEVRPIPARPAEPAQADVPPESWSWPARGDIVAEFGEGVSKGIDIAGSKGQVVQAAARGQVAYAGAGLRGYGKLIIIRHGKTLLSAYAHHARILVKEGQEVARGQVIGEMGDTDADRIKLHFEIRELGKPVNPLNYLPPPG
jgi:lipoprotein NlpD